MDEIEYFRHHNNERSRGAMEALVRKFGAAGYGAYWYFLERVYFSTTNRVGFNDSVLQLASIELATRKGKLKRMVQYMVDLNLFQYDGSCISSHRVNYEVMKIAEMKARRRKNGGR